MSSSTADRSGVEDLAVRWERFFRKRFSDNDEQVQAAVNAAMRAAANGASSQAAATAGMAAAQSAGGGSKRANNQGPQFDSPARPGMMVGPARNVQRHTQISNGGSIITLVFRIESSDSKMTQVQMQGSLLDGVINEGDVVEVRRSETRGGRIVTDYAYNRSSNSDVYMRRGFPASFGIMEAHWGKHWKRFLAIILGIVGLFVLLWFAWMIFIAGNFMTLTGSDPGNEAPSPPAWFCEEAEKMGSVPFC